MLESCIHAVVGNSNFNFACFGSLRSPADEGNIGVNNPVASLIWHAEDRCFLFGDNQIQGRWLSRTLIDGCHFDPAHGDLLQTGGESHGAGDFENTILLNCLVDCWLERVDQFGCKFLVFSLSPLFLSHGEIREEPDN